MFDKQKPSLRNFAMLNLLCRSRKGRIYRVQNRRGASRSQLLFAPNRICSWPRYLAPLVEIGATPVRLRNTRVAFLLSENVDIDELSHALKSMNRGKPRFDALVGFHYEQLRKRSRFYIPALVCLCLAVVGGIFASTISQRGSVQQEVSEIVRAYVCEEPIHPGDKFRLQQNQLLNSVLKANAKHIQTFGGYLQASIQSSCTSKDLKITAWLHGKTYEVATLN